MEGAVGAASPGRGLRVDAWARKVVADPARRMMGRMSQRNGWILNAWFCILRNAMLARCILGGMALWLKITGMRRILQTYYDLVVYIVSATSARGRRPRPGVPFIACRLSCALRRVPFVVDPCRSFILTCDKVSIAVTTVIHHSLARASRSDSRDGSKLLHVSELLQRLRRSRAIAEEMRMVGNTIAADWIPARVLEWQQRNRPKLDAGACPYRGSSLPVDFECRHLDGKIMSLTMISEVHAGHVR